MTADGETIEYDHSSHKAMKDYTAYMLAEMLKGTFSAYGSAYGHGVSGVNIAAKLVLEHMVKKFIKNIIYQIGAAKDVWINGFTPNTVCQCGWALKVKQYGTNSFVGHSEQEYPQYLLEEVMSDISPRDGSDFSKPDSVSGSNKESLSVANHPDNNTTGRKVYGSSGSSDSTSVQIVQVIQTHQVGARNNSSSTGGLSSVFGR